MKALLLSSLLLASTLSAITLEALIENSLSLSPSLEVLEARIKANKQSTDVANQFSNPELTLTKNTLDASEAMSQTVLTLKQKIHFYDKRESKELVSLAEGALQEEKLNALKVELVAKLKTEA